MVSSVALALYRPMTPYFRSSLKYGDSGVAVTHGTRSQVVQRISLAFEFSVLRTELRLRRTAHTSELCLDLYQHFSGMHGQSHTKRSTENSNASEIRCRWFESRRREFLTSLSRSFLFMSFLRAVKS